MFASDGDVWITDNAVWAWLSGPGSSSSGGGGGGGAPQVWTGRSRPASCCHHLGPRGLVNRLSR
jgi:hypothetical protein